MAFERLRVFTVIHRNRRIEQSIVKLSLFDEQEFPMICFSVGQLLKMMRKFSSLRGGRCEAR
jgi:hypothetical protein